MTKRRLVILLAFLLLAGAYCFVFRGSLKLLLIPERAPDLPITASPVKTQRKFESVIWLHRVDSKERMRLMQSKYRGFEIDVNFDIRKQCFDVYHLPVKSISLCLPDMLTS